MATVNSVLGPMETADLGFTLMHEHLMVAPAKFYEDYPQLLGENPLERIVEALNKAKEGGVDTLADLTTLDLGRNIELMAEASRRSGVNIIATTGWWLTFPNFFCDGISADQLAELFIKDVEVGMAGTDVKAGLLKSASDHNGVSEKEEIVLRGIARAHLKTGVPIVLHSYSPGQVGRAVCVWIGVCFGV